MAKPSFRFMLRSLIREFLAKDAPASVEDV
jgi:hypothetical protein